MFTYRYRTAYIHGYCDRPDVSVTFSDGSVARYANDRTARAAIRRGLRSP